MAKKVKKTSKTKAAKKKTSTKKSSTKGAAVKKATSKKKVVTKKKVAKKTTAAKPVKKTAKKSVAKKTVAKKKVTKKSSVKKVAKKSRNKKSARNKHLTKADLKKFRALLISKLSELTGDVIQIENGALRTSRLDAAGDLSSMPIHMADMGTDNFEQEFALGLMDSERKMLGEIYDALKRMDAGSYGICEGTQKPISKARLEASPWSRYCIEYARMVEKGLVIEGEQIFDEQQDDFDEDIETEQADDKQTEYDNFEHENDDDF